ncbi:phosphatase PAP2 family protein [Aspergillus vadensis CBS 113365]|uniref:Integral membrane protein n=1 Tax=Aspergillus vadensis (strain CBS 113365 / IMI 142717 / IBT 24658) TaxID=1448311 RepID=A0A319BW32_ASPVC|nr:integral membrane protein [Aspergillus vadensis CBS 113365]PYH70083.1 integral membrane protein [Aspergillus vadensis CBS 113365]
MGAVKNILEPAAIVAAFTAGALINRRKNAKLLATPDVESPLLEAPPVDIKPNDEDSDERTIRNRRTIQSRILAKFPFLLEIWYWLLTYWIYQGLRAFSARMISGNKAIFDTAERHALSILAFEHFLHLDVELSVQRYVLEQKPWLMGFLARVYYSHIVLGVIFIVYCYTCIQRDKYQAIRRTLAFENVIAFTILTLWRCMPPRLLPEEYGFIDVLHSNAGGSAWTQNKFQLTIAAMPSLHFGNSMFIALCLLKFSPHWYLRAVAPIWPMLMGLTIVATANHFILDAVVGACVTLTAFRFNAVMLYLLPVERALFRLLRIEKP